MNKKITVVIPTLNNEKDIKNCLKALKEQTFKDFDVMLVDGYSKDKTVEIGKRYGARIVYDDGHTRGHACNTALKHVDTPYLAFTDADCIPEPNWLEELLKHLEKDPEIAGAGGPNYAPPDDNEFAKAVDIVYSSKIVTGTARYGKIYKEVREIEHNPGCNAAYRVDILKEVGFDDDLPTAEDVVVDLKIRKKGKKLLFIPHAVVLHRRRPNLKSFWRQIYRYGLGRAMANRRYPELFSAFHVLPSLAIIAISMYTILSIVAALTFSMIPLYLLLMAFISYLLLCLYGSATSYSKYKNIKRIAIATFLIPVAHLAWGLGYLKGMRK